MSVLNRLKGILHGTQGPTDAARAVVQRLEQDISAMSTGLLGLEADISSVQRRLSEDRTNQARWERDAESCVRRGDDATARECLRRAGEFQRDADDLEKRQESLAQDLQRKRDRLADLRRELQAAQLELDNLEHRGQFAGGEVAANAHAQELSSPGVGRLEDLRADVESKEIMAEVTRGTGDRPTESLHQAEADQAVEEKLNAMKRQLNPPTGRNN